MDFKTAVKHVFNNYANFNGRASRSEFWYWVLFVVLVGVFLDIVGIELLSIVFALGTLVPYFAVAARRLHDIDKSGWWLLLSLVPIIGAVVLIYWWVQKGTEGPNRFGATAPTA